MLLGSTITVHSSQIINIQKSKRKKKREIGLSFTFCKWDDLLPANDIDALSRLISFLCNVCCVWISIQSSTINVNGDQGDMNWIFSKSPFVCDGMEWGLLRAEDDVTFSAKPSPLNH